jgi:uncharacterized protein
MSFARRVVLQTGVLVSVAICSESVPALVLEESLLIFDVCISRNTLAELATVLSRAKFDRYAPPRQREDFMAGVRAGAGVVGVHTTDSDCIDPKANMFLALAETAEADPIMSNDPHLTDLHLSNGIPILTPATFLVGIR